MEKLLRRALKQGVINQLDYDRIEQGTDSYWSDRLNSQVSVIDSINGVAIASLFDREESLLDRAELQGGLSVDDYGKMNQDDKQQVQVRSIRLDSNLPTVDVYDPIPISRVEFEAMNDLQKKEVMENESPIVDKLPVPDLDRKAIHDIASKISQRTKEVPAVEQVIIDEDEDGKED